MHGKCAGPTSPGSPLLLPCLSVALPQSRGSSATHPDSRPLQAPPGTRRRPSPAPLCPALLPQRSRPSRAAAQSPEHRAAPSQLNHARPAASAPPPLPLCCPTRAAAVDTARPHQSPPSSGMKKLGGARLHKSPSKGLLLPVTTTGRGSGGGTAVKWRTRAQRVRRLVLAAACLLLLALAYQWVQPGRTGQQAAAAARVGAALLPGTEAERESALWEQTAARASIAAHQAAQAAAPYRGYLASPPPRVALMFLVRGAMPLEPLWRSFFETAAQVRACAALHVACAGALSCAASPPSLALAHTCCSPSPAACSGGARGAATAVECCGAAAAAAPLCSRRRAAAARTAAAAAGAGAPAQCGAAAGGRRGQGAVEGARCAARNACRLPAVGAPCLRPRPLSLRRLPTVCQPPTANRPPIPPVPPSCPLQTRTSGCRWRGGRPRRPPAWRRPIA